MSELKITPTPEQVVMLCSGETIELNGKKVSLTVVEQEPESDYSHLVNKWIRVPKRLHPWWSESIKDNSWHKASRIDEYKECSRFWFENFYLTPEHLDLNNPLDYNPTDLIGKYYKGVQIESLYYIEGKPRFHPNKGSEDYYCSDVNPSEVTDAPPVKSLKYEDIVVNNEPLYWVTLSGGILKEKLGLESCQTSVFTERDAKKLRATAQLLVVMHHANGEWTLKHGETRYEVICMNHMYDIYEYDDIIPQIYFRTRELAEQALADNKQLFNEYFGIDE